MKTKKISEADIVNLKVSSLPTRPTAPGTFGGKGYTARDMKEAFDRLPLYVIERLNSLLDDISATGEGSLASEIKTGLSEGHTLSELFSDIADGHAASYLSLGDETLGARMIRLALREAETDEKLAELFKHLDDKVIDADSPWSRNKQTGGFNV